MVKPENKIKVDLLFSAREYRNMTEEERNAPPSKKWYQLSKPTPAQLFQPLKKLRKILCDDAHFTFTKEEKSILKKSKYKPLYQEANQKIKSLKK